MSTAKKNYARFVRNYYDRSSRPLWPPSTSPVELGAYGEVVDDVFIPLGNISDLGVTVKALDDPDPATLTLTASKETKIKLKASGETNADLPSVPQAKAGMSIEFSKNGAFLFAAEKVFAPRIGNLKEVGDAIKALKKKHRWDTGHRVVTSLLKTPSCKIFVSLSSESKVELSFEGNLSPSISELGKAAASVSIVSKINNIFDLNPAENITPFMQLHRLRGKFLGFGGGFHPAAAIASEISYEFEADDGLELTPDEAESLGLL